MDRRSWPWKKKSHDKATVEKTAAAVSDSLGASAAGCQPEQENKKPKYVQILVESYKHLTELEEQVKIHEEQAKKYEEQVKSQDDEIQDLNEKLTEALAAVQAEITTKENLVKQHAKVAEEAVTGWEKAEAEALALKGHLETVTLSKLTAEDRASHLDGALKECMRQIRNLKEEHEQKVQDVVHTKNTQMERLKREFEAKMMDMDQELLRSAGENAALSRSLQERSNMLVKVSEAKAQAEADIEMLKSNIESCEREINSLKYELHIASRELEIRNEERNMSMRSAEAANKQHMEGVKKIAKLEAECQRLRGLVRKKLPGPAALAQMKIEVESLGRDYGETRQKRSSVKPPSPHMAQMSDFSLDNVLKFHKENEFLTERLLGMEEETKMLKEALAKRNSELLSARNTCAKTSSKLQSLEAQLQINGHQTNSSISSIQIQTEGFSSQHASHPPSMTSMSEDGNDDDRSVSDSWATGLISDLSNFKKEKSSDKPKKTENRLELMDDFLEMEKLACLSNGAISTTDDSSSKPSDVAISDDLEEAAAGKELQVDEQNDMDSLGNEVSSNMKLLTVDTRADMDRLPLTKLKSRISMVIDSVSQDNDMEKILEDIKCIVQDAHDTLHNQSIPSVPEQTNSTDATCDRQPCPGDCGETLHKEIVLFQDGKSNTEDVDAMSEDLKVAISQIHEFVLFLGKEATSIYDTSSDGNGLNQKIDNFGATVNKLLYNSASWDDFVLDLSLVLANASELRFNVLGYKTSDAGSNSPDCIDKVALPENKTVQKDSSEGRDLSSCANISDPEVPDDGQLGAGYESITASYKSLLEEFENLKSEKDNTAIDLARCRENLEMTKSQLQETEQLLAELKSQLASAQKSNSLADTQLKCMAESYGLLEKHAGELDDEINLLRAKTERLETELQDEKGSHQDALAKCSDLEEQLQRKENGSLCLAAEGDVKTKQEDELTAAAEKLAECQETIFLLGKQLKAMRPPNEPGSPYNESIQKGNGIVEEPSISGMSFQDLVQAEMDTATSANGQKTIAEMDTATSANGQKAITEMDSATSANGKKESAETRIDLHKPPRSPSDTESYLRSPVRSKHRPTQSTSPSSSPSQTPEKHNRGFSRFFSSKGKNGY